MSVRYALVIALTWLLPTREMFSAERSAAKPNIIFVLADDKYN